VDAQGDVTNVFVGRSAAQCWRSGRQHINVVTATGESRGEPLHMALLPSGHRRVEL
jgi:hypothetical protein